MFHSMSLFCTYASSDNKNVMYAFGMSLIVGMGIVWIPIVGGIELIAFPTPHFSRRAVFNFCTLVIV